MVQKRPRARDLGIITGLTQPGKLNSITDVPGVRVGQITLIEGKGKLQPGTGPVRTGITAVLPHGGNIYREKVLAAVHTINGHGKPTGMEQIRELGVLETPVILTNTFGVSAAWDALLTWAFRQNDNFSATVPTLNPCIGECNDMPLNDLWGRHVKPEHVLEALETASSGAVEEGVVGAGTGMSCFDFKGGIGTASRLVGQYTVGVLLMSNFGARPQLMVNGVPVGKELEDIPLPKLRADGSIMIVIATDAPFSERQLGRLSRRAAHGLARCGSTARTASGDFVVVFSNAQTVSHNFSWLKEEEEIQTIRHLSEQKMNDFFQAVVDAVEEAVLNSLLKAYTVIGRDDHISPALPIERLVKIMNRYGHSGVHLPE